MRVYDSKYGVWLSRDPSGESGGLNPYEFADDDPINEWDPSGLAGEFVRAAEGRVKGAAIEDLHVSGGALRQVETMRTVAEGSQAGTTESDSRPAERGSSPVQTSERDPRNGRHH